MFSLLSVVAPASSAGFFGWNAASPTTIDKSSSSCHFLMGNQWVWGTTILRNTHLVQETVHTTYATWPRTRLQRVLASTSTMG